MPASINIDFDTGALVKAGVLLRAAPEKIKIAISHAVNRSLENFKSVEVRETVKKYFVKRKDIDNEETLRLKKSYGGSLDATLVARGRRHSIRDYALTPLSPTHGKKAEIKGAVKREGGLKALTRAFFVNRKGGKYFPFYRIGYNKKARQRGDIRSYISPSLPQIMKNKETVTEAEQKARETFKKRLDHEIMRLIGVIP